MIRLGSRSSIDLKSLFEREREIAAIPPNARVRMLARAQAALRAPKYDVERPPTAKSPATVPWAAAAGLVFLAGASSGATAYAIVVQAHRAPPTVAVSSQIQPTPKGSGIAASPTLDLPDEPARATNSRPRADAGREELRLLRPARVAVARGDFAKAMGLIAEHARRFKNGRLVEEREALRVKALTGLGRDGEARRAAAAFTARFPRSPLLPAIDPDFRFGAVEPDR